MRFLIGLLTYICLSTAAHAVCPSTPTDCPAGAVINAPNIVGTVSGGATYAAPTLTSPTVTGPTIMGTVSGSATYSSPTITGPKITGTVAGGATYASPTISGTLTGPDSGTWSSSGISGSSVSAANVTPTGGSVASTLANVTGRILSVTDAGAKCDVVNATAGYTITAGSNVLTVSGYTFTSADIGKTVVLPGQGTGGVTLITTISSVSSGNAVLAANVVAGSTIDEFILSAAPSSAGTVYVPGDTITLTGGTVTTNGILTVKTTKVVSATVGAPGSGGTTGTWTVYGTTGNGNRAIFVVTVSGGGITGVSSVTNGGHYLTNPTSLTAEPVTGVPGLTGGQLSVVMGVDSAKPTTPGIYTTLPSSLSQGSTSGSGTGAAFTIIEAAATGGVTFGTDDSSVINSLIISLSSSTITNAITLPPKACGVASTISLPGNNVQLVGSAAGGFSTTFTPTGSALEWIGASGSGPIVSVSPVASPSAVSTMNNGVSSMSLVCAIPNSSNDSVPVQSGTVGLLVASHVDGVFSQLNFASCSDTDIRTTAISSGTGVLNSTNNKFSLITLNNWLLLDGIGIDVTGSSLGDSDFNHFEMINGAYVNSPMIRIITMDNNKFSQLRFFARPGAQAYGVDLTGPYYGGGLPVQNNTGKFEQMSSTSIARGLETTANPITNVLIDGFDPTNAIAVTVQQPGSATVYWNDYNATYNVPSMVNATCGENAFAASQARARTAANVSMYCYNGSQGGYILDDGTGIWGFKQDGSHDFLISRFAGSGTIILGTAVSVPNGAVTFQDSGTWGSGGLNGSIIGGTTPEPGHFTTLGANSTFTGADSGTWGSGGLNGSIIGGTTPEAGTFTTLNANSTLTLGATIAFPSARKGTFTCTNGGTIAVSNTNMASTSNVIISMSSQGGTITTPPAFKTVTGGTGFSVLCGATDTSVYNYVILN